MMSRARLEPMLMRVWQGRSWVARMLLPLSWCFGLLLLLRRSLYALGFLRQTRLPVPVIIVGNIFVGGTGKTPLVIWLVEQLRAHGWYPGVISRGYGTEHDEVIEVDADAMHVMTGDEPVLIAERTGAPVFVGRYRVAAAQQLLQSYPDVDIVISDDGLQHYSLARTLEVQICDSRGHGNGWLLPAGPLREPASRGADFFVVNASVATLPDRRMNAADKLPSDVISKATSNTISIQKSTETSAVPATAHGYRMVLRAEFAERLNQASYRQKLSEITSDQRIVAAAGIGHPQRFFDMLSSHGIVLADTIALPDHFDYRYNPFAVVDADMILITEKDAVKCARIEVLASDARLWVVPVTAVIAEPLIDNILEALRGRSTT